jgi:hypothetical protein
MKVSKKKISVTIIVLLVLAVSLIQTSRADTVTLANSTAKDKLPEFLSQVIGLDLTKYNITNQGYGVTYPSRYGGVVKEENIIFTLDSKDSKIAVAGVFDNGYIYWINFYPMEGSIIYAKQPSTNAFEETKNILQRYQTFTQNYGVDSSHIALALSMLSNVVDTPSLSANPNNLNSISNFASLSATSENMTLKSSESGIGWGYSANGVGIPNKSMGIDFGSNTFTFADTWDLYSIGSFSVLSKDEALNVALTAAKNYNLTLASEKDALTIVKPDWSSITYDIGLNMIPGQTYNTSLNNALNFATVGDTTRNPLALYPLWQVIFYFNNSVGGGITGIQVGVWGDTKEIAYCSTYGFLGDSIASSTPTAQPSASPLQQEQTTSVSSPEPSQQSTLLPTIILSAVLAAIIVIALVTIAVKKRSK